MNLREFAAELQRRNVYKIAASYAVVAWLVIQVATQVLPFFELPNGAVRLVVLLVVLGFPIALIVAWAFEVTPTGIKRADTIAEGQSYRSGGLWIYVVIASLLASGGLFLAGRYVGSRGSDAASREAAVKSIAVLPFENLSDEKENAYFVDGVQDQILTNLAKVADLKVISHTSARQYKTGAGRNLRQIGQQLGVSYILEGSVQRAHDRLRINAELIDARTDAHIWAETYDRTAADLFAIQSELAQAIAGQLKARLSPKQKAEIEERPTQDLVAYELYLQAKEIVDSYISAADVRAALLKALACLDQAIKRDENFVAAYCYAARGERSSLLLRP